MPIHVGRLFDHVHIVVSDLEKSRSFYKEVFSAIGKKMNNDDVHDFGSDEFFVSQKTASGKISHIHLAFQAPDLETVRKFHEAVIKAGGLDNGKPGERSYHPGYFAAFVLDPDGNNLEAVFHGPASRSAESVVITPE